MCEQANPRGAPKPLFKIGTSGGRVLATSVTSKASVTVLPPLSPPRAPPPMPSDASSPPPYGATPLPAKAEAPEAIMEADEVAVVARMQEIGVE